MERNELRKVLYEHKNKNNEKDIIIRIRKDKDIVYYNGIKILEILPKKIKLGENSIYLLNKAMVDNEINKVTKDEDKVQKNVINTLTELRNNCINELKLLEISSEPQISIKRHLYYNENKKHAKESISKILDKLLGKNITIKYEKKYKINLDNKLEKVKKEIEELASNYKKFSSSFVKVEYLKKYSERRIKKSEEIKDKIKEIINNNKVEEQENKKYWKYISETIIITYTINSKYVKVKEEKLKEIQEEICDNNYLKEFKKIKEKILEDEQKNISYEDKVIYIIDEYENLEDIEKIEYDIRRFRNYDKNLTYRKISSPDSKIIELKQEDLNNIKNDKIDVILNELYKNVSIYENKVKYELEKNYQYQFMLSDIIKKKLKYSILKENNKNLNYKNIDKNCYESMYPFEQEYFILNKDGRIDSIFLDIKENGHADLYMIELKVDYSVIGGDNGVHKHLKDISEFTKNQTKLKQDFLELIKYRRKILNEKEISSIDKINFFTIIGVTSEESCEVVKKILEKFSSNDKTYFDYGNLDKSIFEIPENYSSLKTYIDKVKQNNCDVKFFIDNWKNKEIHDEELEDITNIINN